MTGVLDRLEEKGLIHKIPNEQDGRSYRIGLTKAGDRLFKKAFPEHVVHLEQAFSGLSKADIAQAIEALKTLRSVFN